MDSSAEKHSTTHAEHTGARFAVPDHQGDEQELRNTVTLDTEKGTDASSAYANSTIGLEMRAERKKSERRLLFKLDRVILPLAFCLYLSAYLDRGNLANARLQGLEKEVLEGKDSNYSLALSCFFITYIALSIPGTLLAKAILPSTSISIGALIWSIGATCQAATTNPAGLYVCRLFVGVGEAMFGQAMALHLSLWYTKHELSKRVGFFIGAGSLAGAFGGLISFGVSSIKHSPIDKWRILFLIEGIPSFILALVVFFCLPSRPDVSKYLNTDERTLALTRLNEDSKLEANNGIEWRAVRYSLCDWKTYWFAVMYSCMNFGLGSVGGFLPTIIKGLGYTDARAQLFTVPPYAVSLVFMLLLTTFSDRKQSRGIPSMVVYGIGIVGWTILYTISPVHASHDHLHVRYFGVICVVTAGYSLIPIVMSQVATNAPSESQRAVSLGMLNCIGQSLSIAAAFAFPSKEGPKYSKGSILNITFQSLGFVMALMMTIYLRRENARRDRVEGPPQKGVTIDTSVDYDRAVGFRYVV